MPGRKSVHAKEMPALILAHPLSGAHITLPVQEREGLPLWLESGGAYFNINSLEFTNFETKDSVSVSDATRSGFKPTTG